MQTLLIAFLLGLSSAIALHQRDNTQPVGENPVAISQAEYLGGHHSSNSCTHRNLGFAGPFAGSWYAVYGDTLWCEGGVSDPNANSDGFHGMVRDAIARLTGDPLTIKWTALNGDSPIAHPMQFVPSNEAWGETSLTGFGGTSLCEVDSNTALGFYLVNQNDAGLIVRFGHYGYWWGVKINPHYGDVAAYRDVNSDYIYAWGGALSTVTEYAGSHMNTGGGRDQGWKIGVPLTEFNADTAVMWGVGQGQIVYSDYYKTYMYVHFAGAGVAIRTASAPEGPWSADVTFFLHSNGLSRWHGVHCLRSPLSRYVSKDAHNLVHQREPHPGDQGDIPVENLAHIGLPQK
ncbi:hypothetical protein BJX64DRAFT_282961 [Aspergillus heterothallicus]